MVASILRHAVTTVLTSLVRTRKSCATFEFLPILTGWACTVVVMLLMSRPLMITLSQAAAESLKPIRVRRTRGLLGKGWRHLQTAHQHAETARGFPSPLALPILLLLLDVQALDLDHLGGLGTEERARGDVLGPDLQVLPPDRLGPDLDDDLFKKRVLPATIGNDQGDPSQSQSRNAILVLRAQVIRARTT